MASGEPADEESYTPVTMESLRDTSHGTTALGLIVSYVAFGVGFYSQVTEWDLSEALYFVIITLSTVGLGDLAPWDAAAASNQQATWMAMP